MKLANAKDDKKKKAQDGLIKAAHEIYLSIVSADLDKAEASLETLAGDLSLEIALKEIREDIVHGRRQIDQIKRRVLRGEVIPHNGKVFSIFEEHTEWISKRKALVPVEFGLKVCILEDQYGFILQHRVMENQTDGKSPFSWLKKQRRDTMPCRSAVLTKGFTHHRTRKTFRRYWIMWFCRAKGSYRNPPKRKRNHPFLQAGGISNVVNRSL